MIKALKYSCLLLLVVGSDAWISLHQSPSKQHTSRHHQRPDSENFSHRKTCTQQQMILLSEGLEDVMDVSPFLVAGVALVLFAAAQTFINQMLEGDQGLGAFLKDGSGYNRSGFNNIADQKDRDDPLPWLKLPKLDFVEVAGQADQEEAVYEQLETMRREMNHKLEEGNTAEATVIKDKLEKLMRANGIEFNAED
jgi:hypothetical protein